MKAIINGMIVTGDGCTIIDRASIFINGQEITEISNRLPGGDDEVIDAEGKMVIPGLINHHVHGVTAGPLFPSAALPLPREKVMENLKKHLQQGTTTLLNLDGFATPEEVADASEMLPIKIKTATSHTPLNFQAAQAVDGKGLSPRHLSLTVEQMLDKGAVAIGEIGGGHTLGGGGQEYLYIPKAIKEKTGKEIEPAQARILKNAVLGRFINSKSCDPDVIMAALEETGLKDVLTVPECKKIIENCVLPSFNIALESFAEAAKLGKIYNKPVIYHNSAPSMEKIMEIAGEYPYMIAAHSNHTTYEPAEAVTIAKALKKRGCIIDSATLDGFIQRKLCESPEIFLALFEAGLTDLVSTDYTAGAWESILLGLEYAVNYKKTTLPGAIATATFNVVKAIPGIAPNGGLLEPGKIADITIVNKNKISEVQSVLIDGRIAFDNDKGGCIMN